jgi:hypothetical protein
MLLFFIQLQGQQVCFANEQTAEHFGRKHTGHQFAHFCFKKVNQLQS